MQVKPSRRIFVATCCSASAGHANHPPQVVLERNTRNKKKCVTTISGLDLFGVKLAEASKIFGKKFASGASIVKNAEGKEQIDIQVSWECTRGAEHVYEGLRIQMQTLLGNAFTCEDERCHSPHCLGLH